MTSKFKKFFQYILSTQDNFEQIVFPNKAHVSEEQQKIINKVQKVIDDANLDMLVVFIENGYLFNKNQLNKMLYEDKYQFSSNTKSKLFSRNADLINEIIKDEFNGFKHAISNSEIMKRDIYHEMITPVALYKQGSYLNKYVKNINLLRSSFTQTYYSKNLDNLEFIYDAAREQSKEISNISQKNRCSKELIDIINKQNEFVKYFTTLYNENFAPVFVSMTQRSNILAMQQIKDNINTEMTNSVKEFNLQSFPENIQKTITTINDIYSDLLLCETKLSMTEQLDCNNLYSKRLPQVIAHYVIVPQRYRDRLKDTPDSPDKLVFESLSEIKDKLSNILESVQHTNIQTMKKTQVYLKTM